MYILCYLFIYYLNFKILDFDGLVFKYFFILMYNEHVMKLNSYI